MDPGPRLVDRAAAPQAEPITLAEAKAFLGIPGDFAGDDLLISLMIQVARDQVEANANRALVTSAWRLRLDAFPGPGPRLDAWHRPGTGGFDLVDGRDPGPAIELPRPPLASVDSITYLDPSGIERTLDPDAYRAVPGSPGRVAPAPGRTWPATAPAPAAVRIEFTAGYGPDPADLPPAARLAVQFLVTHYFEHRSTDAPIPGTVDRILDSIRWGGYA